jgi:hypothetical protein
MAFTLKPGALNTVNKMLKVEGAGIYTTQSAQTPTLTFKVKLCTVSGCGSGTVITACSWTTAATTASVTNSWYIDYCKIGTISTGATGTVIGKGGPTYRLALRAECERQKSTWKPTMLRRLRLTSPRSCSFR